MQTYIQRLVHPMWDNKLVVPTKIPQSLVTNLSEEGLKVSRHCTHAG